MICVMSSPSKLLSFLIFVISIYIARDIPRIGNMISNIANQPGYRQDAERLMADFVQVWNAYLRGQVILGLAMGIIVGIVLAILGVSNALALGLLSGLLEFLPVAGPVIGGGAAILVAFFQNSNYLGFSSFNYALLIAVVMILLQQLENNLLVPRIVGGALDLHPLIVMISVLMGASLAGILGAVLAAPVVALLPILVMWLGIGETMKIAFLFIGAVVYLIPMVRDAIQAVPQSYWIGARDLGATPWECIHRAVIPMAMPRIADAVIVAFSLLGFAVEAGYCLQQQALDPGSDWTCAGSLSPDLPTDRLRWLLCRLPAHRVLKHPTGSQVMLSQTDQSFRMVSWPRAPIQENRKSFH